MEPQKISILSIVLSKQEFINTYEGIKTTFSENTLNKIPSNDAFLNLIFKEESRLDLHTILSIVSGSEDILLVSLINRIVSVNILLHVANSNDNNNTTFSITDIWPYIYNSLIFLDKNDIIATIGSQGFLSIPLYHRDKKEESFAFLRLHIWDNSLKDYIDREKTELFAIHSHQFHANSWILIGEIFNTIHDVLKSDKDSELSYFEIQWKNDKNDINRKTSVAVNTGIFVDAIANKVERYYSNDQYEIHAGNFHLSRTNDNNNINSTIFLFSTEKSRVKKSYVIGPSSITESEINRKVNIDAKYLLIKLNAELQK